jgi:hypothetical protein
MAFGNLMNRHRILLPLLASVCLLAAFAVPARAGTERIAGLTVTVDSNRRIRVTSELIRWMSPDLEKEIESGIPKDLFYTIVLKRRIPAWFDEEIQSRTIKHAIKYDVIKKQYLVSTWDGDRQQDRVFDELDKMMELISSVNNVKMDLDKALKTRHTYYVSVKAEVKSSRLPFYLDYILFFIPVPELDTPWADSAPFYAIEPETGKIQE